MTILSGTMFESPHSLGKFGPGPLPVIPYDAWMAQRLGVPVLTREVLAAHQLERLNRTLVRAARFSPWYARRLRDLPVFPLRSLADIVTLPLTTPEELRTQGAAMLCVDQGAISRVVSLSTSGTTGEPKQLQFTEDDQDLTLGIFRTSMTQVASPGEACFVFLPCTTPGGVGDLLCRAISAMGARPVPWGLISDLAAAAQAMAAEPSCTLVGIPIQILALARFCQAQGLNPLPVRSALLCTDYVSRAASGALTRLWGCPVFEYYGLTEACYAGGMECAAHEGCHMHETDLFVEILDPDTCKPVPDGEEGEVVITTLLRRGMPLIRYRTGDISRILPAPCPCGSVLRRLAKTGMRLHCLHSMPEDLPLAMAALDEALLPLPWLGSFHASFHEQAAAATLTLTLCVTDMTDLVAKKQQALQAVRAIPAVAGWLARGHRQGCEQGPAHRLAIVCEPLGDHIPATASKRRIVREQLPGA